MDELTMSLQAAQLYSELGLAVFPVRSDKTPLTPNGFKDATIDLGRIRSLWEEHPTGGIAIRTGVESGIVVLDVDPRAGGDESLARLEAEHGPVDETVTCKTGGGGVHLYFKHPGEKEIRSKTGRWPGLDVRADGGYVVAPLSWHSSGQRYMWVKGKGPGKKAGQMPFAEMPAWLAEALEESFLGDEVPQEVATVTMGEGILEGMRNSALASYAGTMHRKGMAFDSILVALQRENQERCKPPLDVGEVEVIVKSITGRYVSADPIRLGPGEKEVEEAFSPANMRGLVDLDWSEETPFLVEGLLPLGGLTMLVSEIKTGKTLISYRLVLDLLFGDPVWDRLEVKKEAEPVRIGVFQFEMPLRVDILRYRKLLVGKGREGRDLHDNKRFSHFSLLGGKTLADESLVRRFHQWIARHKINVVMVDSLLACASPVPIVSDNVAARDFMNRVFAPLTAKGVTCLLLHHTKKQQRDMSGAVIDAGKDAMLGSVQLGAASSALFHLRRESGADTSMNLSLKGLGSWTLGCQDLSLSVDEVDQHGDPIDSRGPGIQVHALTQQECLQRGGVDAVERAAVLVERLVREAARVSRQDLMNQVMDEGVTKRTFSRGLKQAVANKWVSCIDVRTELGSHHEYVPGEVSEKG